MTFPQATSRVSRRLLKPKRSRYATAALVTTGVLAASALLNYLFAKRAERANPPQGKFLNIHGVKMHYVERGEGEPLVLLHGNGSMIQDFETSGLIEMAAKSYRVFAFDRPGYGHSDRPRSTIWTANAQAELIHEAMVELGIKRAIVLGHSWGASVAVALALHHPETVGGLVLASGYYYPSMRSDVVTASGPAVPIFGDVLRYTVSPMLGRAMWPLLVRKIFGPSPTPAKFDGFPVEMALRPSTLRASAAESALMIPDAFAAHGHYAEIKMPVAIVAGEADKIVDVARQSARLHDELPQSTFDCVPGVGHMIHQTKPERVMAAIDMASGRKSTPVREAAYAVRSAEDARYAAQ
jgi:pimeloyl-ACP methyl ester carboxylesterase